MHDPDPVVRYAALRALESLAGPAGTTRRPLETTAAGVAEELATFPESGEGAMSPEADGLLIPNVLTFLIGDALKPYKTRVSSGISMVLAYLVAALAQSADWTKWIVALLNGLLVFASAVGINEAAGGGTTLSSRRFFWTWF